ncbi:8411_t:CDS:2 [Funneliformis mosseae]|uniref:8411_t:CDS:1 n=1 Tax=Funneliformis mosseae TaxID=27381 RepID=A0A9N9F225_FUNMO|nr:8411_t:CDS:2 [Funneliformis mosseae]
MDVNKWCSVLEKTFLKYVWTEHAKKYTYTERSEFTPEHIEKVLIAYERGDSPHIKEREAEENRFIPSTMTTVSTDNGSHKSPTKLSPNDTVYRYYEDTDILSVYFAKASSGVVSYSDDVNKDILVSYDHDDKIVSVEIYRASELLRCHFFDTQDTINNKPPLLFIPVCYKDCDELKVYLVDSISSITLQKTEEEDLEVGLDNEGKIVVLLFHKASSRLAKTLSEEERRKLAEKSRLRSLEIAKWSYLLDK